MHLHTRNVNTAFHTLVKGFYTGSIDGYQLPLGTTPSTQGECIYVKEPMIITYSHVKERCLFNAARDWNPYLCLYEALYMLTGRNDLAPLAYYAKQWEKYSDDGKTLQGAYGKRWRAAETTEVIETYSDERYGGGITGPGIRVCRTKHIDVDQIEVIIDHLRANPTSRRAVLQMWDVEQDLLNVDKTTDCPCNLNVLFQIDTVYCKTCRGKNSIYCSHCGGRCPKILNITVNNRSNDILFGMLGTNHTTFTILQEYVAAHLGLEVGVYHQISNNAHFYKDKFKPEEWLAWKSEAGDGTDTDWPEYYDYGTSYWGDIEPDSGLEPRVSSIQASKIPLVKDPAIFDKELPLFVEDFNGTNVPTYTVNDWDEPFLDRVAKWLLVAFRHYKKGNLERALEFASKVEADDWRIVSEAWIQRRINKRKEST